MSDASQSPRRASEVARLSRLLESPGPGLTICAVSGPGGVGKSYLVEEVLSRGLLSPRELGYLHLALDAANPQTRGDFFGLVEGQLAARALPPPAKPGLDYFPQTRKVAAAHRELVEKAASELRERGAPDDLKRAASAVLRAAHRLNELVPKSKGYLDVARMNLGEEEAGEALDEAWEIVATLRTLRESTVLPGPLRDLLGATLKNRVRRDLFNATADALLSDLTAAISGYEGRDFFKLTQPRIEGVSRLLVVLDDYEALAPLLGDFLVGSLVPRLASAPFPTLLVVACRDDLEATHPGWAQHAKRFVREQIRLAPFDRETAMAMLAEAGIPEARRDPLHAMTQGFPFLLALAIEEATAEDAESALFVRKFYDRTTRWMSPKERAWFSAVCYLETVNEDTLSALFEPDEIPRVQDWFERESSVRDPTSPVFQVRPLIRDKVLRYLETRSPSRHRAMLEKVAAAGPEGGPVGSMSRLPAKLG